MSESRRVIVPPESDKIFPQRLKEVRVQKGLTQDELAEKISVIPQAIDNFENGHNLPSFSVLVSLAQVLGCSLDYLAGLVEAPRTRKGSKEPKSEPIDLTKFKPLRYGRPMKLKKG
jgi:transcriptional regulator with XRE-family HTH domain